MALLPIVKYGDPVLRKKTALVERVDDRIRKLIEDMFQTMYAAPGVGLAANQVGLSLRLAVIDIKPNGRSEKIVLINPEIESLSGDIEEEEGCLSLPGFYAETKRRSKARVRALNESGLPIVVEGEGLLARALQHEIDHLEGKVYIDHVGFIMKRRIESEVKARQKRGEW